MKLAMGAVISLCEFSLGIWRIFLRIIAISFVLVYERGIRLIRRRSGPGRFATNWFCNSSSNNRVSMVCPNLTVSRNTMIIIVSLLILIKND